MKILRIVLALTLVLALAACGAAPAEEPPTEEAKDHYYQILNADGTELYTVTDQTAVAEIDAW